MTPKTPRRLLSAVVVRRVSLRVSDRYRAATIMREYMRRTAAKTDTAIVIPQSPTETQQIFIECDKREALYGGAAGGGKTSALLLLALRYVDDPHHKVLILRKTYSDLSLPGAIMDRAGEWLRGTAARWSAEKKQWLFPSGSSITFGHLDAESDKYRYQGAELTSVLFDELTQFTESQYLYVTSRVRRGEGQKVPLLIRAASNPGGIGHQWVYDRFVADNAREGCAFVPAKLADNPHIDASEYRQSLERLDSVTRMQLLDGVWINDNSGRVYAYEPSRNITETVNTRKERQFVLSIDLGASAVSETTAFCLASYGGGDNSTVWVESSEKFAGLIPSTIAEKIKSYQKRRSINHIICDAGALGIGYIEEFRQRYYLPVEPARKKDKAGYRKLLNGDFERGKIKLVDSSTKSLQRELMTLVWDERGMDVAKGASDHESDAMLYAWRECRYWQEQEEIDRPKHGTKEYYENEEILMEQALESQAQQEVQQTKWWNR